DSIWTPVSKYLATLPKEYDRAEVYSRYRTARQASVDLLIKLAPSVKGVLTAQQRRNLPSFITGYLDPHYLAAIRSGTQGSSFGFGLPGGVDVSTVIGDGGGGAFRVI